MNYKFYIYKQATLVNFDKYDLTEYSLLREITQNSKWGLKIERDREWFTVIRRTFSGEVTVKGADFDALIATEGDTKQYALVIHRECSGVYTEFWKGYFSYFDFKVNLDTCYLTFEPTVWDAYTPIYDEMDIDRNILAADVDWLMRMKGFEWDYEKITVSYLVYPFAYATYHEYTGFAAGNRYYLYQKTTVRDHYNYDFDHWVYMSTDEYRRDYSTSTSNIVPPPGTAPPGDPDWILDPQTTSPSPGEISPGVYKWVRPYLNSAFKTYTSGGYSDPWVETLVYTATETIYLFGLKRLSSVLEYFSSYFYLDYVSDFFNDSPCPMGGTSLDWTMIQHISNLEMDFGWETARKSKTKLKDLLNWIRDTFNVYWYIDSVGDWRFEHRKYFDMGLSYTVPAAIGIDLATLYPANILHLNKYEWNKPELCRFEKLEFPYSYAPDWTEASIEYPQLSVLNYDTKSVSVEWATDIWMMNEEKDSLSKEGWVLYNVGLVGGFYQVINTVGDISGKPIANARFSQANLMRDLWGWGRILPTGNVNGEPTTFSSIERLRKQVTLSIPQCCVDIDYNGLFRTELGDGLLDSAEYEQNGTLKLNLIYE